jgi:hypothetical protein
MKTRWALLSAAIFFGFLSSQVIAEGVLGQGNISCDSWMKVVGMAILLQRPERPGFLAL